jgi:hypothetical protein
MCCLSIVVTFILVVDCAGENRWNLVEGIQRILKSSTPNVARMNWSLPGIEIART